MLVEAMASREAKTGEELGVTRLRGPHARYHRIHRGSTCNSVGQPKHFEEILATTRSDHHAFTPPRCGERGPQYTVSTSGFCLISPWIEMQVASCNASSSVTCWLRCSRVAPQIHDIAHCLCKAPAAERTGRGPSWHLARCPGRGLGAKY